MNFELERFVKAQAGVYSQVVKELGHGRKTSHWIWFIFPQVAGLGMSPTSKQFSIDSLEEARAYLSHPVLGERLRESVALVTSHRDKSAEQIFGGLDAMKFRSSLTLFKHVDPEPFGSALEQFFDGGEDESTNRILASWV